MSKKEDKMVDDIVKSAEEIIVEQISKSLNLLVDSCQATSDQMGGELITMDLMIKYKDVIINNYAEGLAENPSFKK